MNDKELLEFAAKAAGIDLTWMQGVPYKNLDATRCVLWNPLTDDGDALRLAVKLHITPSFTTAYVITGVEVIKEYTGQIIEERLDDNPYAATRNYAATRRAIVRAAAEIGKSK